jgi:hypothetical protein
MMAVRTMPGQFAAMRAAWKEMAPWVMSVSGMAPVMIWVASWIAWFHSPMALGRFIVPSQTKENWQAEPLP